MSGMFAHTGSPEGLLPKLSMQLLLISQVGLGVAVEYANRLGMDWIWARIQAIASELRAKLAKVPGVRVHDRGRLLCGLVSFTKVLQKNFEISWKVVVSRCFPDGMALMCQPQAQVLTLKCDAIGQACSTRTCFLKVLDFHSEAGCFIVTRDSCKYRHIYTLACLVKVIKMVLNFVRLFAGRSGSRENHGAPV